MAENDLPTFESPQDHPSVKKLEPLPVPLDPKSLYEWLDNNSPDRAPDLPPLPPGPPTTVTEILESRGFNEWLETTDPEVREQLRAAASAGPNSGGFKGPQPEEEEAGSSPQVALKDLPLPTKGQMRDAVTPQGDLRHRRNPTANSMSKLDPEAIMDLAIHVGISPTTEVGTALAQLAKDVGLNEGIAAPRAVGSPRTYPASDEAAYQMLLLLSKRDPKRFRAVWAITSSNPSYGTMPAIPGYDKAWAGYLEQNVDPVFLAETFGFSKSSVDQEGPLTDPADLAGASPGAVERRANILNTFGNQKEVDALQETLFPSVGDAVGAVDEDGNLLDDFGMPIEGSSLQNVVQRKLFKPEEMERIQNSFSELPFDRSRTVTDANFGGILDSTIRYSEDSGLQGQNDFWGERFTMTFDTDLHGLGRAMGREEIESGGNMGMPPQEFGGKPGFGGVGQMSGDPSSPFYGLAARTGIVEPWQMAPGSTGSQTIGQGQAQTMGDALSDFKGKNQLTFDQIRNLYPKMSLGEGGQLEAMQRDLWRMGYYGETAIKDGDIPRWGYQDPESGEAYFAYILDIFMDPSRSDRVVGARKRREFQGIFDELRTKASGELAAPTGVDRAGVVAEFGILSDDGLELSIQSAAQAEIGERIGSDAMEVIKAIIRGAENERIDATFAARVQARDQQYEIDKARNLRSKFGRDGTDVRYDENGNQITLSRNPSAGQDFGYQSEQQGMLVEPVQGFDPLAGNPTNLVDDALAGGDNGSVIQGDTAVVYENVDADAMARMQMRRTRGDQVFAQSMGGALDAFQKVARGEI